MYTWVLDKNWIRDFFRSIGYTIGPPPKIYEDNQSTIKRVLANIITPQDRTIDVLITAHNEIHLRNHLKWCTQDQTCNMLTSTLNLMAEKFSEISLIMPSTPNYILPQDHLTMKFFVWASFMGQLTSIEIRIIKVRSKDKNIQCMQS